MPEHDVPTLSNVELVRRYLRQQREMYGEKIWLTRSCVQAVPAPHEPPMPAFSTPQPKEPDVAYRFNPPYASLDALCSDIQQCQCCGLGKTRNKFVFGVGNPHARMMFIGEAPGRDEDMKGEPFVGRAGQLLDKILAAINLSRQDVYIANILKCRPPENRNPAPDEVQFCEPHLMEQVRLINPKIIVALGRVAACNLLKNNDAIRDMRGRILEYEGRKLIVTYHPAALLRNPALKRPAWEDVQMAKKLYDEEA